MVKLYDSKRNLVFMTSSKAPAETKNVDSPVKCVCQLKLTVLRGGPKQTKLALRSVLLAQKSNPLIQNQSEVDSQQMKYPVLVAPSSVLMASYKSVPESELDFWRPC